MEAQTVGKSNSALGAFYRRLCSRLGTPKAITTTAYKITLDKYCDCFITVNFVFKWLKFFC